jgi:hypothetical protein
VTVPLGQRRCASGKMPSAAAAVPIRVVRGACGVRGALDERSAWVDAWLVCADAYRFGIHQAERLSNSRWKRSFGQYEAENGH